MSGFKFGFSIHFGGARVSCDAKNLLSASQNPEAVEIKIKKELAAGRLAGPFLIPSLSPFCISLLGTGHKVQEGVGRKNRFSSRQSFSGPPFLVNTKIVAHPFNPDTKITDPPPPPLLSGAS